MSTLYPMKFDPIFKDKIWGGHKIKSLLGKDYGDLPRCGESWELSGVKDNVSILSNGRLKGERLDTLIEQFGSQLLGKRVHDIYGKEFPLLIKFIDANRDLSIQVHPNDTIAMARHGSKGKTEMWYVVQADQGAHLISGFNRELDKQAYLDFFEKGQLEDILNKEQAEQGDVFYIPAGRVHTIGKGLLIAEIQQTSDITYRIYDFDRVDASGNKRELHLDQALEAIDFTKYPNYRTEYGDVINERIELVKCEYFSTTKLTLDKAFAIQDWQNQSFKIYTCVQGKGHFSYTGGKIDVKAGEVVLVPASLNEYEIIPEKGMSLLETFIL